MYLCPVPSAPLALAEWFALPLGFFRLQSRAVAVRQIALAVVAQALGTSALVARIAARATLQCKKNNVKAFRNF